MKFLQKLGKALMLPVGTRLLFVKWLLSKPKVSRHVNMVC